MEDKIKPTKPKAPRKPRATKKVVELTRDEYLTDHQQLVALGLPATLAAPLTTALTLCRESSSVTEAQFAAWLVRHVSQYTELRMVDTSGNMHFVVPCRDGSRSKTLFVAHIDTVHSTGGANSVRITDEGTTLAAGLGVECLGADNGAGLSLLVHMIANRVPGTYIFTRQEECGGIGAKGLADAYKPLLRTFDRAITFDRRGTADVITHQGGTRCASTEFGEALADALMAGADLLYMPSDQGVYTDTKEFIKMIPECTNISTGYACEHGPRETLDLKHYKNLAKAVLKVRWEKLPAVRDPSVVEQSNRYFGSYDQSWMTRYGITQADFFAAQAADEDNRSDEEILAEVDSNGDPTKEAFDFALDDFGYKFRRSLMRMLAKALMPEDPSTAEKYINLDALTVTDTHEARKMTPKNGLQYLLSKTWPDADKLPKV